MLNLQLEDHVLKNMSPRLSLTRHTQTITDQSHGLSMTPVSIEQLRATLRQESIKSKSSQRQNWMAIQNTMVQTIAVTSKHEDCNLMFTNHGKEDGIYPLKEIAKHKTKIRDLSVDWSDVLNSIF
jgi:hypothetical protein